MQLISIGRFVNQSIDVNIKVLDIILKEWQKHENILIVNWWEWDFVHREKNTAILCIKLKIVLLYPTSLKKSGWDVLIFYSIYFLLSMTGWKISLCVFIQQ